MKIIKPLVIGLGVVVVVVVLFIIVFVATFDANQYKQELSDLVRLQTGRELAFQGDIGLTLYPSLGMKLGAMSFSNAPGFGDRPMLVVEQASVSVDLLSILSMKPEIAQLQLKGLQVDLQKNAGGNSNWDDLVKSKPQEQAPAAESSAPAEPGLPVLQGAFAGLDIVDLRVNWTDRAAAANYQMDIASLSTGRIEPGRAFPLRLQLKATSGKQLNLQLQLSSQLLLDTDRIKMQRLQLQTQAGGDMIPLDRVNAKLASDLEFVLASNQLIMNGFEVEVSTAGGAMQSINSKLQFARMNFSLDQQQLGVKDLSLVATLQDPAVPQGRVETGFASKSLQVALNERSVLLEQTQLDVNGNRFKGFVRVMDYARPAVNFELDAELVDVDSIMGSPPAEDPQPDVSQDAPPEDIQIQLPLELLRQLYLDGRLGIKTLKAHGLTFSDVELKIDADKGLVVLKPIAMNLYSGRYQGDVQLNAQGEQPEYRVSSKLSSFQAGDFLHDLMGDDKISGVANLDVNLTTSGEWLSQLKSALNGSFGVKVSDGALKGFNLRHMLDTAKAKFNREKAPALVEKKTDFSALSVSGQIVNGVLNSDDLDLQAPLLRVGGKGSVNLVGETLNYLANAKVVTTTKGQQGGTADELAGLKVPVLIKGPWLQPDIDIQYDDIMKAKLAAEKARIREQVSKQKQELQKKLAEEKARLQEARQREAEAKKQQLQNEIKLREAEGKARLEAEKKEQTEKAKKKLQDKLKKLF